MFQDIDAYDPYVPIAPPDGYPPLDYRPIALRNWFLALSVVFFFLCLGGIVILVVLNNLQPDILHLRVTTSRLVVRYSPGILGSITTLWFRTITQSYLRYIPYIAMASVDGLEVSSGKKPRRFFSSLNGMSTFDTTIASLFFQIKDGHWFHIWLFIFATFNVLFLTPLKGAFSPSLKIQTAGSSESQMGLATD